MAIVKFGAFVTGLKGKIGGTVYQSGKIGYVAKNNTGKRNGGKLTKADAGRIMQPQRTISRLATTWRTLTDAQRLSWSTAAVNYPFKNKYGESYTGSGYQVYMALNSALSFVNRVSLTSAPVPAVALNGPEFSLNTLALPAWSLVIPGGIPAGYSAVLWAWGAKPYSTNTYAGGWKAIKILTSADVLPIEVQDDYSAVFGTLPASNWVNFKIILTNNTTGQKGLPSFYQFNA